MHKGGWKPFWAALGAALLVLLPLVGGTVLLTRQMLRQQWLMQTAEPQRGVPIDLPKADDRMTLLLCTAGEQPGFVLFYLNAPQNAAHLLAVPGQLTVPFGGGEGAAHGPLCSGIQLCPAGPHRMGRPAAELFLALCAGGVFAGPAPRRADALRRARRGASVPDEGRPLRDALQKPGAAGGV